MTSSPRIRVLWPRGSITARLETAGLPLLGRLPLEALARTWGEEVYFEAPAPIAAQSGDRDVVEPGTLCYWHGGAALALPFGPTPIARAGECRLAAPCTIIGRIEEDPRTLASMVDGDRVRVEAVGG